MCTVCQFVILQLYQPRVERFHLIQWGVKTKGVKLLKIITVLEQVTEKRRVVQRLLWSSCLRDELYKDRC